MQGIRGDAGCMAKARVYPAMHCRSHRALCCIRLACTLTHLSHPMCICTYREARLLICTGAPIQPHDCTGLEGLPVRYRWAKIPPLTFAHINLDGVCASAHAFKEAFGIAQQEPGNMDEYDNEEDLFADVHHHSFHCIHAHILSICTYLLVSHVIVCRVWYSHTSRFYICMMHPQVELYIPDEVGCEHILPDGVRVMVRLRLDTETNPDRHRYVPEWMLPDRRPSTLHCIFCICALAMYTHPHRLSISL